jgi:hypothetical protein
MTHLDELLTASAPRIAPADELDELTRRLTRRPRHGALVAGFVALSLGGATAAAAAAGAFGDLVDDQLGGPADYAWQMQIEGSDGVHTCYGGILVFKNEGNPDYIEANYLAIKEFVQQHDWSDLQPDRSLLRPNQSGTAEELAVTADRHMIVVAEEAGFTLESISTRGTATCVK